MQQLEPCKLLYVLEKARFCRLISRSNLSEHYAAELATEKKKQKPTTLRGEKTIIFLQALSFRSHQKIQDCTFDEKKLLHQVV